MICMQFDRGTTKKERERIIGACVCGVELLNIYCCNPNDSRLPKGYEPYAGLSPCSKKKGLVAKVR